MAKKKLEKEIATISFEKEGNPDLSGEYVNDFDTSNALVLPLKKKKAKKIRRDEKGINAKKLEARKARLAAKEAKELKAKKKKLARVLERKTKKQSRESLFESLSRYQLPTGSVPLVSPSELKHGQRKRKKVSEPQFPKKLRSLAGSDIRSVVNKKPYQQKDYYETGSESDEEKINVGASTSGVTEVVGIDTMKKDFLNTLVFDEMIQTAYVPEDARNSEDNVGKVDTTQSNEAELRTTGNTIQNGNQIESNCTEKDKGTSRKTVSRQSVLVKRTEEIKKQRAKLPIFEEEQTIVEAINENTSVIICGETGSGKTTQLPQFLYEAGYATSGKLIGISEPRRVAAISMATRVGYELCDPEIVSYQIRYEGNRTKNTRILFMTDGVLMKELQKDILLSAYSVIIIDEAHERSMYSDVLIGLLSRIAPLRANSSDPLKFIIMSATLRLSDFTQKMLFPTIPPRVLKVDARQYSVTPYFERRTPKNYMQAAFKKVCRIHETKPPGTILVFLSGRLEVETLLGWLKERYPIRKGLRKKNGIGKNKGPAIRLEDYNVEEEIRYRKGFEETDMADSAFEDDCAMIAAEQLDGVNDSSFEPPPFNILPLYCLPLYSLLSSEKQKRVFEPFPDNCRGCIISTNVAETSLTIPGVRYVIDSGREKRRLYDPVTGVSKFSVQWISQASADQRMGRAGRVQAGEAYRLFSRQFYSDLEKFSEPEILNKPVDQLVLHMKSMNIVKVANFPFPSRPDIETLEEAEKRLIRLGALEVTVKNGDKEARISSLGRTLSLFPLAPKYGKMLVMAKQNDLLPYACWMVAIFSVREPLVPVHSLIGETNEETMKNMLIMLKTRRVLSGQRQSRRFGDMSVLLKAVLDALSEKRAQHPCSRFGVRYKALTEIRKLTQQLTNLINTSCTLEKPLVMNRRLLPPEETQFRMLRQIVIASLTENIARRVDRGSTNEEIPKDAYECLRMKDYVFIDACSVLHKDQPDWVLYLEIIEVNGKKCMRDVMAVEPEWLPRLAPLYCHFTPVKGAEPKYDSRKGVIVIEEKGYFGERDWPLGIVEKPLSEDLNLYRLFARFFLDGSICSALSGYADKLLASPSTMLKPWAKLQQRTEKLLNVLIKHEVTSRSRLMEIWKQNAEFLLHEYLEWLPVALHDTIQLSWPPI